MLRPVEDVTFLQGGDFRDDEVLAQLTESRRWPSQVDPSGVRRPPNLSGIESKECPMELERSSKTNEGTMDEWEANATESKDQLE